MPTHTHPHTDALIAAVSAHIANALDEALAARGRAVLALAGGRTSPPVFRALAQQPRDWSQVTVLPSDERWVAHTHADCNLRQMQEAFAGAAGICWQPLVPALPSGEVSAAYAEQQLAALSAPFDLTMVGMGADGHFASLFPGAPTLAAALDLAGTAAAAAIVPNPMPSAGPHPRVSLTLPRLLHARRVLLVITGADKLAVLQQASTQNDPARWPVAALLHAPQAVEVHWAP